MPLVSMVWNLYEKLTDLNNEPVNLLGSEDTVTASSLLSDSLQLEKYTSCSVFKKPLPAKFDCDIT